MRINPSLSSKELSLIKEILIRREPVLAWTFEECSKIRKEVTPV
ncbi:hypothetical protein Vi05172_g4868 [Venturia inaequalis]|nr:hypothetical protein Vi05172_g4868 [Venturia inaequalis]